MEIYSQLKGRSCLQICVPEFADPIGSKSLFIFEAGDEASYELVEAVIMRDNPYH